ncbi:hypothetical protein [Streptomyces sp. NPDC002215]|uniref:hypothetical protein n=1 Tax=Streptomyces sp. NPDC002215 TaxID=3154412 RepID=UPI0033205508
MDLNRSPYAMASAAAEEIRALNHRTLDDHHAYPYPASINETNSALKTLAQRLPQTIGQLREALDRQAQAGHIRLVVAQGQNAPDIDTRMEAVRNQLFEAEAAALALEKALEEVGNLTCDMGYGGPVDDEDEDGS